MRLLLIAAALHVGAFTPSGDGRPPSRLRAEGDAKPKDPIVSAAGWPRVKALLDRLPVFTVAGTCRKRDSVADLGSSDHLQAPG